MSSGHSLQNTSYIRRHYLDNVPTDRHPPKSPYLIKPHISPSRLFIANPSLTNYRHILPWPAFHHLSYISMMTELNPRHKKMEHRGIKITEMANQNTSSVGK